MGGREIRRGRQRLVRKDTGSKLGNHAAWGHLDGAPNWRVDLDENPGRGRSVGNGHCALRDFLLINTVNLDQNRQLNESLFSRVQA